MGRKRLDKAFVGGTVDQDLADLLSSEKNKSEVLNLALRQFYFGTGEKLDDGNIETTIKEKTNNLEKLQAEIEKEKSTINNLKEMKEKKAELTQFRQEFLGSSLEQTKENGIRIIASNLENPMEAYRLAGVWSVNMQKVGERTSREDFLRLAKEYRTKRPETG
jgi:acylphosphatase